uniref:Uncharacterized protein n=1 Tax=Strigamia maritima TaxID=126957 RepID=T1J3A3_STRMM
MIVPEIAPEVTITSLAKNGKGLCRTQVTACFISPDNNRKLYCTLECSIEKTWLLAMERNCRLQNRVKFRLDSVHTSAGNLVLNLGFTTCKDFLGTNCKSLAEVLCWTNQGLCCYCDRAAYFANPLAVGALVHTIDDKYIFLRRRKYCCLDVGYTDRACGFVCPQKALLDPCSCRTLQATCGLNDVIYDAILNLIDAEMAIPLNYLGEPELLGFAQDRSRGWAPSLEFYVNCTLDSERIYFLYSRKQHSLACNSTCIILATWSEMISITSLFFRGLGVGAK